MNKYSEEYESCLNDGMENWKITIPDDFKVERKSRSIEDQQFERELYKSGTTIIGRH